jgi:hypothetical protein
MHIYIYIHNILFKHPVASIYLDTQYTSVKNATTPITVCAFGTTFFYKEILLKLLIALQYNSSR